MEKIIAKVEGVDKSYQSGTLTIDVLQGVTLSIYQKEIIVIYGKSGSGKSTFLSVLGGLNKPDKGKVVIGTQSLYDLSEDLLTKVRSKNIGYIFQSYNLIDDYTSLQNMRLPFYIQKKELDTELEKEVFKMLDIEARLEFYPQQLSGGERQRIGIARALLQRPGLIIADEPTGNLDNEASSQLMKYIKRSNQEYGQTFIIVSHDFAWFDVADRVLKLENGRLREDKT